MALLNTEILEAGTLSKSKNGQTSDSEVSLIDLLTVLLQKKRLIFGATITAALLTAVIAVRLPISYTAQAVILAPQQQQSSLSAMMSAGAMGGMGIASQLGLKGPSDLYIGLLGSRSIADDIVSEFHLRDAYKTKFASDARKVLLQRVTFTSGKDTLIKIEVTDHDAARAAGIANAFVDRLYQQNSRLAVTDASQRRLFFEQQVASEKDALAIAETALKNTQQSTGLLAPGGQAEEMIRTGAELRAEIVSREVRLQAMSAFATDENPQKQVLELEIKGYKAKLSGLEANSGAASAFDLSAGRLPGGESRICSKSSRFEISRSLVRIDDQAIRSSAHRRGQAGAHDTGGGPGSGPG